MRENANEEKVFSWNPGKLGYATVFCIFTRPSFDIFLVLVLCVNSRPCKCLFYLTKGKLNEFEWDWLIVIKFYIFSVALFGNVTFWEVNTSKLSILLIRFKRATFGNNDKSELYLFLFCNLQDRMHKTYIYVVSMIMSKSIW